VQAHEHIYRHRCACIHYNATGSTIAGNHASPSGLRPLMNIVAPVYYIALLAALVLNPQWYVIKGLKNCFCYFRCAPAIFYNARWCLFCSSFAGKLSYFKSACKQAPVTGWYCLKNMPVKVSSHSRHLVGSGVLRYNTHLTL
jgi:hypothetical protein